MWARQKSKIQKERQQFHNSLEQEQRWTICDNTDAKDGLDELDVNIIGPPNTPYEMGIFQAHIEFPRRYPLESPDVCIKTPIFHPIINRYGTICLAILHYWDASHRFVECLEATYHALKKPREYLHTAIDDEALFLIIENPQQFERKARDYTINFALRSEVPPVCALCVSNLLFFLLCSGLLCLFSLSRPKSFMSHVCGGCSVRISPDHKVSAKLIFECFHIDPIRN